MAAATASAVSTAPSEQTAPTSPSSPDAFAAIDQLNAALPIYVTAADATADPTTGFVRLLKLLTSTCLAPTGASRQAQADADQARDAMERARTDSLRHEIVLQQLEELLADYWVNMQARQSINPLHNNPEVYETAEALLRLQQCIRQLDYAPVPPRGSDGGRDDSRLLGVSEDDLRAAVASSSPHAQPVRLRAIIQGLIPELEGRLQRKCEMLLDVYPSSAGAHRPKASSSSSLTSSNLDRARASQLVKLLQIDLAETADLKQRSRRAEAALQRLRDEHFQCLAQTLQDLHTLLAKHRLRERFDHDDITCRWLKARLRATREKLQVMLGQLKLDIYTPGNIQALRRIKGHLDAEISKQQAELQAARAELQVYQNIGGEFEQLQQQYAEITAEIENKRWALKEFGSRS